MSKFVCLICGYIHTGEEPPEKCPICDAPKDQFEKLEEAKATSGDTKKSSSNDNISCEDLGTVVILGGGIAALSAAETVRENCPSSDITMVTNEERLPYYRLNLTKFLADEVVEGDLMIHNQYWYDEKRIHVLRNKVVTDIDRDNKAIHIDDDKTINYDHLIIALGSHPFVPPIEGVHQPGVFTIRSLDDAKEVKGNVKEGTRILVIGGGVLGLETASALAALGGKVTVAEGSPWLMPRQLNKKAAEYVVQSLSKQNIEVEYDFRTNIIQENNKAFEVVTKDGRSKEVDMVIIATGVRPNTYLARKAGLHVNNGIIVDDFMKTSDPSIYAVGDISEHYGIAYGLWSVANFQGKIGALNLAGQDTPFGGIPRSNTLKVMDIDVFSIGKIQGEDGSYEVMEILEDQRYLMFMVKDGQLIGSIAIGYPEIVGKVKKAVESGLHLDRDAQASAESVLAYIKK